MSKAELLTAIDQLDNIKLDYINDSELEIIKNHARVGKIEITGIVRYQSLSTDFRCMMDIESSYYFIKGL